MTGAEMLRRLEPYRGKEETLVASQDTGDIMKGIEKWHKQFCRQYDAISSFFKGKTAKETGANIFHFLKKNVSYKIETDDRQTLKTPAAILATGHGDCKHYALFAAGVLDSLAATGQQRIPWAFRFASYRWYDETPQHVFVVLYPNTEKEIWIDPVLGRYDQKKPYTHAIDRKMALVGISGVTKDAQISGIKQTLKKGKTVVLKVAAAPSRAAFLGLVALNVFGLGNKLATIWRNNPASLKNWWAGLGGDINKLVKTAEKGAQKKKILGAIGAVEAIIAAAAPVLVALIDLFKRNNIPTEDIEAAGRGGLDLRAKDAALEIVESDISEEAKAALIEKRVVDSGAEESPRRAGMNVGILVAGAAVLLLVATRKK